MTKNRRQGRNPVFFVLSHRAFHLGILGLLMIALGIYTSHYAVEHAYAVELTTATPTQNENAARPAQTPVVHTETPTTTTSVSVAAVVPIVPAPPACQPSVTYTRRPSLLNLASQGVSTQADPASLYQVFGYDVATVRAQMLRCGAAGEFAAETSFTLNWSYLVRANDAGQCSLSAVMVGVHTDMLLPSWQASSYDEAGLSAKWQRFSSALQTHESGHVMIAQQYGQRMVDALQQMPATDCNSASNTAAALANSIANEMQAAQVNYDASTNHGATQGATW